MNTSSWTRRAEFWRGMRDTVPLVVGAVPFGIIFGAVAVSSGVAAGGETARQLSPLAAQSMSLFVYAGASQFIAAELVRNSAGVLVVIFTTLIVNLRHALYSASLAPYLHGFPQHWLLPLGFTLTDETFVVSIARYQQADASPYKHWYQAGSAVLMYSSWQLCTLIGILAGRSVPAEQVARLGLSFAATVTFIGMLIPLIRSRALLVAVVAAGAASVLFNGLPSRLGLLAAALVGIAAGMLAERTKVEITHG
ncbi:MAG: AzlC family ABC transporter permease [Anaerolineae bacterium]|nr:AzlC family ABC transporter permease [Anaerolineae bacterium]